MKLIGKTIRFAREWAMPSPVTFSIPPIAELLGRYIHKGMEVIDPFSGKSEWATRSNDLNPLSLAPSHQHYDAFLSSLVEGGVTADVVLIDPPYSPRQISECYKSIGMSVSSTDTQNAKMYKRAKDFSCGLLRSGGLGICCGWNSSGFGVSRGFQLIEILMVAHGGAHNDTIVTVERKTQ